MILCAFDIEATGLDKQKDRMIEVGLALYSTAQNKVLESTGFMVQSDGVTVSEEITGITGITQAALDRVGYEPVTALEEFNTYAHQADAIIAHNGERFDKPMVEAAAARLKVPLEHKLWIDTMTDIPGVKGEQLITMCAKVGFLYNAHSALDDAKATVEMARRHSADPAKSWEKIVERAQSPIVLLRAHQDRDKNEDAKKFKFRWNPENKIWWKPVKEMDIPELESNAPFGLSRLDKTYTIEMLDTKSA